MHILSTFNNKEPQYRKCVADIPQRRNMLGSILAVRIAI
jgi:hypothetical protein